MITFERGDTRARELFGDFWLNSDPVLLRDLRGSVVLVDFWDYSCVECLQGHHYIKEWISRYREFNLTVIGVHTPQFKFGKVPENVDKALKRLGITYPVVMDNEALIWTAYSNRVWPTRYLIDRDGFLRYSHHGDGYYARFERAIQTLLVEAGYRGILPDLVSPVRATDASGAVCFHATPGIQLGYLRGTLGNTEGYAPESTMLYDDQGFHLNGRVYLKGKWFNEKEGICFNGEQGDEGEASLTYEALEVKAVMSIPKSTPGRIFFTQDGKPLAKEIAGSDIRYEDDGNSYVLVDSPRLFSIVCNPEFGEHTLGVRTSVVGLEIFSFGFITGVIPELVSRN